MTPPDLVPLALQAALGLAGLWLLSRHGERMAIRYGALPGLLGWYAGVLAGAALGFELYVRVLDALVY
ncbi:MAG: hypothetical protein ACREMG_04195 [Gemmatimonadales bacterium]